MNIILVLLNVHFFLLHKKIKLEFVFSYRKKIAGNVKRYETITKYKFPIARRDSDTTPVVW